jgi:hypothetical protein
MNNPAAKSIVYPNQTYKKVIARNEVTKQSQGRDCHATLAMTIKTLWQDYRE